jgi:hypothetical protein
LRREEKHCSQNCDCIERAYTKTNGSESEVDSECEQDKKENESRMYEVTREMKME